MSVDESSPGKSAEGGCASTDAADGESLAVVEVETWLAELVEVRELCGSDVVLIFVGWVPVCWGALACPASLALGKLGMRALRVGCGVGCVLLAGVRSVLGRG